MTGLRPFLTRHRDNVIVFVSFASALLVGAVFFSFLGVNPWDAYSSMLRGAFGSQDALFTTLSRAAPYILASLSVCVAFSSGMWNIGGEGQLYLGAFAAAWAGFTLPTMPHIAMLFFVLSFGVLVGAAWAWIPGRLSLDLGMNLVVVTIMLNSVGMLFTEYLATGPYAAPEATSGSTVQIHALARFAKYSGVSNLNSSIFIVLLMAVVIVVLMIWAVWGYECRMIRLNPRFAFYGGIPVKSRQMLAMVLSGALAGLAGALLVMGDQYRFLVAISPGYSWTAMILAMMVNYNPVSAILASIVYAAMSSGALEMELLMDIPSEVVEIMTCLAVLFVTAGIALANRYANRMTEE